MKTKSLWQIACERESEHGGGMRYILDFLLSIHATSPEAQADLGDALARFDEQMAQSPRPL